MGKEFVSLFSWANTLISLKEKINDDEIKNNLDKLTKEFNENIHTGIENRSIKYLEFLYKKDITFYQTINGLIEFNIFVCEQYFRTNEMKKRMINIHIPMKNVNFENCWNIGSHILASNLAGTLSMKKEYFKLILLDNTTTMSFITSDQPVINIAGDKNETRKLGDNELEIYYPITPKLAILICLKENLLGKNDNIILLDELKVKQYNEKVINQGGELLFSNSKNSFF